MMSVTFSHVADTYAYPFDAKEVGPLVRRMFPALAPRIRLIRFICSNHARTLASVADRRRGVTITVNFATKGGVSRLLSHRRAYLKEIEFCGGSPNLEHGIIVWSDEAARRYAVLLLAHEIGHIAYADLMTQGRFAEGKGGGAEEKWCSAFAFAAVRRFQA